jgi:membrane-bound inhibitor of C-type lysozyme
MSRYRSLLASALALAPVGASGDESALTFPTTALAGASVRDYACETAGPLRVAYVATADGDALAYFLADGRPHIFVRVIAERDERYVSGPYVWATAGTRARLTRSDDPAAAPLLDCVVAASR